MPYSGNMITIVGVRCIETYRQAKRSFRLLNEIHRKIARQLCLMPNRTILLLMQVWTAANFLVSIEKLILLRLNSVFPYEARSITRSFKKRRVSI